MSITKRLVDLAKSNLNSLLEKAAETADPRRKLSNLSDAELEAELSRRRHMREGEAAVNAARARVDAPDPPRPSPPPSPSSSPPPRTNGSAAGASTSTSAGSDREARERVAREREARVKAAREARDREARDRAAAADRARAQQAKAPPPRSGASGPPPGANAGAGARRPPRGADPMVVQYYARLELTYGAPWEDVKASYRRLMRKYHPDLHGHSPEKLKAATEVSQALTQAYNELDKLLNK